ncbi:hypothetical protein ACJ72_05692 [Emergomyces africanus]|uniref:Uncharacterized protein n=1 Tax=Emergomyces africanus TaxID=1955775 RepID=A0A1B7NT77_9EURO|nr:hypothetical protein ACJ72_05692 [Emergomyces africanus]
MGTATTKKNHSLPNRGSQQSVHSVTSSSTVGPDRATSSVRAAADGNLANDPAGVPQSGSMRLPPIDPSRAQAPGRRLPPLFPRPTPVTQPLKPAEPPSSNTNSQPAVFPATAQPTTSSTHMFQSIYLREIEFHCICAARRFWEDHRPLSMINQVIPNISRPPRPYGSDTPWRGIDILTDPGVRDLQQPTANIFRVVNQTIRNDEGLGLREYLSLIADLDWRWVQQQQQHQQQPGEQNQQPVPPLQQQEQQRLAPSRQSTLIPAPRPPSRPPNTNLVDIASQAYWPQFTTIQLLDDLHTWGEAVMEAVHRVHVGDGDKGPVELSLAELEGVVSAAKGLTLSLNGTIENYAIGEGWAKCLQSRYS